MSQLTFWRRIWLLPLSLSGLGGATLPSSASDADPAVDAIVKELSPPELTRSFRNRGLSVIRDEIPSSTVSDVSVNGLGLFALGSHELTDKGRAALNNYVKAFNTRSLKPYTFLIVGHASKDGSPSFNWELSQRRAEAARQFIIGGGNGGQPVDPSRILIAWRGSDELANTFNPNAPENRRFVIKFCGRTSQDERWQQCERIMSRSAVQ